MTIRAANALLLCVFFFASPVFAEIPKYFQVSPQLHRGAQPTEESDYDLLIEKGVRSIINLRTTKNDIELEKARWHAALLQHGVQGYYFSVPMSWLRKPKKEKLKQILNLMTEHDLGPVFIHCTQGKDRTGLMVGLYRVQYEHWNSETAYNEMRSFGFNRALIRLKSAFKKYSKPHALD